MPSDHPESQTPKKQRLLDQNMTLQSPSNGHLSASTGRSSAAHGHASLVKNEFGRGTNNAQQSPNAHYQRNKLCESNSVPKQERSEPAQRSPPSPKRAQIRTESEICTDQQLANGQHKKKKSKKHKEKERERLKPEWVETSPDLKQNQENINGECGFLYFTRLSIFTLRVIIGHLPGKAYIVAVLQSIFHPNPLHEQNILRYS